MKLRYFIFTFDFYYVCIRFVELVPVMMQELVAELPVIPNLGGITGRLVMRLTLGLAIRNLTKKQQCCNYYNL